MFARIAWLFAAVLLLNAHLRIDSGTGPTDLQGIWRLVSLEAEAGAIPLPDPRPELVIKDRRVLYGGEEIARIAADAATNPKVLDLRFPSPERVYEGVYGVAKDSLKICLNGRHAEIKERPQSFSLKDHPAYRLLVFERVKTESASVANGFVGLALSRGKKRGDVIIGQVLEGSPAQKAGLRRDDLLLKVGGVPVTDFRAVIETVQQAKPGSVLVFQIRRDDREREVTVKVGPFPFARLAGLE